MKLSDYIEQIAELRDEITEANKHVSKLKSAKEALEDELLALMGEQGTTRLAIDGKTVSRVETVVPQVYDWDAFYQFVKDHDAQYLFERRVSSVAYRDLREAQGTEIDGVQPFVKVSLSLRSTS